MDTHFLVFDAAFPLTMSFETVAFLDLETTGFAEPKITELSIVACSYNGLINAVDETLPRVLNKLSLCVNPNKLIDVQASQISGLDNVNLANESIFSKDTGEMIQHFFRHLKAPVCLIAHNGQRFDFRILKDELNAQGIELKDVVYVDSLKIFREIGKQQNEKSPVKLKYTLGAIYERIYGKLPDQGHHAEADVITLLKCVLAMQDEFFDCVDTVYK